MEGAVASGAMSTDPQTTGSSSGSGAAKGAAPSEDPRYTRDELPEYLGVAPHIVVGALHGERNQSFTIAQAKRAIDVWLKRPVEPELAQVDDQDEEA